jgi:YHS domain-containing protein
MTTSIPEAATHTDPVCGMKVDSHSAADQLFIAGRTVFFCSEACRRKFELAPDQYPADQVKRKGIWHRYLERLTKATGGKPQSCCH